MTSANTPISFLSPCRAFAPGRCLTWAVVIFASFLACALKAQQPRVVFITSISGTADLGSWPEAGNAVGAEAGDEICRTQAQAAGLDNAGSFLA